MHVSKTHNQGLSRHMSGHVCNVAASVVVFFRCEVGVANWGEGRQKGGHTQGHKNKYTARRHDGKGHTDGHTSR